jgi:nucleotide-binding universal stress UspA family protein
MQNIKSILTPIDFSDNAGTIVKAAAYVAGTFKAELHLVFVVQNFEDYSGFFVPPVNLPNLEEELFASAQQQMETYVEENKARFCPGMWLRRS